MNEVKEYPTLPISSIDASDRVRQEFKNIDTLATSINRLGQLQPIVVEKLKDGTTKLVAGERRLRAMQLLGRTDIMVMLKEDLNPLQRKQIELEENLRREQFEWTEELEAMLQLLEVNQELDPIGPSSKGKKGGYGLAEHASYLGRKTSSVAEDMKLARACREFPSLKKEVNKSTALKKLKDAEKAALHEALAKKVREEATVKGEGEKKEKKKKGLITVVCGDSIKEMKKLENASVDMILADPPYGKDLELAARGGSSRPYRDDFHLILETIELTARECYRILKQDRVALFFFDIVNYEAVKEALKGVRFSVYDHPLIWVKPSPGNIPSDAYYGLSYELALHCQKGTRALNKPGQRNWMECKRVPPSEKAHPVQKPLALLRYLIEQHTLPGELIVDPFMGSGSTLKAAAQLDRRGWGCELSPVYYNRALTFLSDVIGEEEEVDPTREKEVEGDTPYKGLTPGTNEWVEIWKSRPDLQQEMLHYTKERKKNTIPASEVEL